MGVRAAAGAALLVLATAVPVRTAVADDLVRENLPCNLLCRIFLGQPEPAGATETAPQSAVVEETRPARGRSRPRRPTVASRPAEPAEPPSTEIASPLPGVVEPGPDLGAGSLDDGQERPAPRRRVRRKRVAGKPAGDAVAVGRASARLPPAEPAPAGLSPAPTGPPPAAPTSAAASATAPPQSSGGVTRVGPPAPTGDKASPEERRKAAMAAEEAMSARLNERARRALNSMCAGCLGRPAANAAPAARQVEPMTEAAGKRTP